MNTAYNTKQKVLLMTIALSAIVVLLGLNACQKTETEAGIAAQAVDSVMDKVGDASRDTAKATMEKASDTAKTAGEMAETAEEKAGEAYQAAGDALNKVEEKGADAYESTTKMVVEAMSDTKVAATKAAANRSGEALSNAIAQVTPPKTD